MVAVVHDHQKIVQLLLDKGADINAKDKDGVTAYTYPKRPDIKQILKDEMGKAGR